MIIKNIVPCDGWYFTAPAPSEHESPIVFKVAAWALYENGDVVGLVNASGATTRENVGRLVAPPPIKGSYRSEDQLNTEQRTAAGSRIDLTYR
jgi:hypothetical protein